MERIKIVVNEWTLAQVLIFNYCGFNAGSDQERIRRATKISTYMWYNY
jgi:hypothetical protein